MEFACINEYLVITNTFQFTSPVKITQLFVLLSFLSLAIASHSNICISTLKISMDQCMPMSCAYAFNHTLLLHVSASISMGMAEQNDV